MRLPQIVLAAIVGLSVGSPVVPVRAQTTDNLTGTWTLDVAKSTFNGAPGPKSLTLTFEETAAGVKSTSDIVLPDGQTAHTEYTAKIDGQDYPVVGSPAVDTVALSRQGDNRIRVDKKAGKVVITYTGVLAADGKTFTVQQKGVDPAGQPVTGTLVFVKKM